MRQLSNYIKMLSIACLLSSCAVSTALVTNHNQNATEVQISQNNFKVVDQISGSAEASYIMAIGGIRKKQLYANAYTAMLKNAKMLNTSKAITNVMTEEHFSGFAPFFVRRTITVSAQVVEFTK